MMEKIIFLTLFALLISPFVQQGGTQGFAQDVKIYGKVTGEDNKPLNGANVVIEGTIDGATADSIGYYEFETSKTGQQSLLFTYIEYNDRRKTVVIEQGRNIEMNVQLRKAEVETEEILVTASSYTSGQQSQVTITPLEIVRIPGSDGDLYRAITTFPGSNQVDEGSRITVRGGDENEVLTILDQASLHHPFIFDDDFNTSSYTTINPWGLKGINFSSGGFSAKYGNVLSAVLDLKSYEMPQGTGAFLWLGLANVGLSGVFLSNDKKFGATVDIGQTILDPYFRLNGYLIDSYNPIPLARGVGGTISFKPNDKSNLKAIFDYSEDRIGIRNTSPSYDGYFNSKASTIFSNLKYSTGIGSKTYLSAGLSFSNHKDNISYGILNNDVKKLYGKLRLDLTHQLSKKIDLNFGSEYEYNEDKFAGRVPLYNYNLRLDAPNIDINSNSHTGRIGTYVETQLKPFKTFFAIAGLRADYHTLSKKTAIDPRLSLGWKFAENNILRGAVGLYHQFPRLEYYAQSMDFNLKPEQAIHYILGYEFNKSEGLFLFRVEAYYKDYKNLVIKDANSFIYSTGGKGQAKGIDVFIKSRITNKYSTWISYAYTDSKRRQYDAQSEVSANYDITHNLTFVGSYNITDNITTGLTYRISTGKPYTPVSGSNYDTAHNVYEPIYSETNSGRFPTYQRMDINFQYFFSLFGRFAIVVFQINNLLNQKNLYDYTYNFDYSLRKEIVTTNKRQFYLGFGLQL
ncbi:MAG: TonB-dependent receptor [Chlorobi bacterium]|nr:TonB-dependent receptor [Chlorobiota bacterium]